jgi:hypothetical protein
MRFASVPQFCYDEFRALVEERYALTWLKGWSHQMNGGRRVKATASFWGTVRKPNRCFSAVSTQTHYWKKTNERFSFD